MALANQSEHPFVNQPKLIWQTGYPYITTPARLSPIEKESRTLLLAISCTNVHLNFHQLPATVAPNQAPYARTHASGREPFLFMIMLEATQTLGYAAVLAVVEQQIAGRAGISCGSLRVLVRVSVLKQSGALICAADVVKAKAAAPGETRQNIKRLLASGHLERQGGPVNGRLTVSESGRNVMAEFVRGLHRARRLLLSFESCPPFRRVVPKIKTQAFN